MPDEPSTADGQDLPEDKDPASGPDPSPPENQDSTAGDTSPPEETGAAAPEVKEPAPAAAATNKRWYVVKVQSGREESIREAIERRVKIEGLDDFFGQIVIPTEKVTQMRNNKRVVREQKLYPGYLMCEVEFNDRILYLFRETSGVGDFVGGGLHHAPVPMSEHEVERMLGQSRKGADDKIRYTKPKYDIGNRVKVKDGTFSGMEGEVKDIIEAKGLVKVELTIFGRPVPVELEYWQVDQA